MGYAKVIRERKRNEKMDKCPRYLKQWVLRCLLEKREMNKIAHDFLQKFSKFQSREICLRNIVELE